LRTARLPPPFPYTPLFRSPLLADPHQLGALPDLGLRVLGGDRVPARQHRPQVLPALQVIAAVQQDRRQHAALLADPGALDPPGGERKSTRLNSSHVPISYA